MERYEDSLDELVKVAELPDCRMFLKNPNDFHNSEFPKENLFEDELINDYLFPLEDYLIIQPPNFGENEEVDIESDENASVIPEPPKNNFFPTLNGNIIISTVRKCYSEIFTSLILEQISKREFLLMEDVKLSLDKSTRTLRTDPEFVIVRTGRKYFSMERMPSFTHYWIGGNGENLCLDLISNYRIRLKIKPKTGKPMDEYFYVVVSFELDNDKGKKFTQITQIHDRDIRFFAFRTRVVISSDQYRPGTRSWRSLDPLLLPKA